MEHNDLIYFIIIGVILSLIGKHICSCGRNSGIIESFVGGSSKEEVYDGKCFSTWLGPPKNEAERERWANIDPVTDRQCLEWGSTIPLDDAGKHGESPRRCLPDKAQKQAWVEGSGTKSWCLPEHKCSTRRDVTTGFKSK